jgi:hypothetical protein
MGVPGEPVCGQAVQSALRATSRIVLHAFKSKLVVLPFK